MKSASRIEMENKLLRKIIRMMIREIEGAPDLVYLGSPNGDPIGDALAKGKKALRNMRRYIRSQRFPKGET